MLSLFDIRTNGTARASTGKAHGASNIAVDPFNTDIVVSYSKSEVWIMSTTLLLTTASEPTQVL